MPRKTAAPGTAKAKPKTVARRVVEAVVELVTPEPEPAPVGVPCRRCGCCDLRVIYTRRKSESRIVRRRACRHCGHEMLTVERYAGD